MLPLDVRVIYQPNQTVSYMNSVEADRLNLKIQRRGERDDPDEINLEGGLMMFGVRIVNAEVLMGANELGKPSSLWLRRWKSASELGQWPSSVSMKTTSGRFFEIKRLLPETGSTILWTLPFRYRGSLHLLFKNRVNKKERKKEVKFGVGFSFITKRGIRGRLGHGP